MVLSVYGLLCIILLWTLAHKHLEYNRILVFYYFGYFPRGAIATSYSTTVWLYCLIEETPNISSGCTFHCTFLLAMNKFSSFSNFLLNHGFFSFFESSHLSRNDMVFLLWFVISLRTNGIEHIFKCLIAVCTFECLF